MKRKINECPPPCRAIQKFGVLIFIFMCATIATAQQPNWSLHNSIVDYQNTSLSSLPGSPNPEYTQNALWDDQGNLICHEADGKIWDGQGNLVLQFFLDPQNNLDPVKGFTEFVFIPVPGVCNQFYGVIGYNDGESNQQLLYCVLDVDPATNTVTPAPVNNNGDEIAAIPLQCEIRSSNGTRDVLGDLNFFILLEATQELSNGQRKLFVATPTCLITLQTNTQSYPSFDFIDGYRLENSFFTPINLRTELEVFQVDDDVFDIITPRYSGYLTYPNEFTHFNIDFSSSTPSYQLNHYSFPFNDLSPLMKGVEFSEDGKTLYLSALKIQRGDLVSRVTSGAQIIYYTRPNTSSLFQYQGAIVSGSNNADYGFGMIEKGEDGKLCFIGDDRLGNIANNNIPSSTLNLNALSISNSLSIATDYSHDQPPSEEDEFARKIYLMIDQVDNETTVDWFQDDLDQWPDVVSVCGNITNLSSSVNGTWVWTPQAVLDPESIDPCSPPEPDRRIIVFENKTDIQVEGMGTLYFFYELNGCCFYEEISIQPLNVPPHSFSWVFTNDGSSVDLTVTGITHSTFLSYDWVLEEYDSGSGNWVQVQSVNNHSNIWNVTGLDPLTDYRISMTINADPQYVCPSMGTITETLNTGGRIGTFSGEAISNQNVEQ